MATVNQQIKKQLENISKADLHIHSNYSDGVPTIEEILEHVEHKTDLDVIAITDHDTIEGALYAKSLMDKKKHRFDLIVGEEVSSNEGHILGLFLTKKVEPFRPAHEIIRDIHKQGGIAIAAHPFYRTRFNNGKQIWADGVGANTLLKEKTQFNAIETVNATPTFEQENLRAKYLNRTLLFRAETGSSDAHILDAIGKGYTIFEGVDAKDLKEAILTHQTQAVYDHWNILGVLKYAYFFLPKGLRTAVTTIVFGPRKRDRQIINFPNRFKLKKEVLEGDFDE
jgi:predicted metal-dependent phosphoesterase TrpH